MRFCTHCKQSWDATYEFCPRDGTRLTDKAAAPDDPALVRRFEFVAALGRGPHGMTYLSHHRLLGERRIVKVLAPEFASQPLRNETVRRFRLAKALSGPSVQGLFELEPTEKGQLAVEAEWIDGESLARRQSSGRVTPPEASGITFRLASVLAQAHSRELLHLDLKPENVILRQGKPEQPVLTDFLIGQAGAATAPYLPPEARDRRQLGPASDVYMLGRLALALFGIQHKSGQDPRQLSAELGRLAGNRAARCLAAAVHPEPAARPSMHQLQQAFNPEPSRDQAMRTAALQLRQPAAPRPQPTANVERHPAQAARNARKDWMWIGAIVALTASLAYFLLVPGSGSDRPGAPMPVEGSDAQMSAPLPRPSVSFSLQVLSRPDEGDPLHHPHTLITLNGFNLFVLRYEAGHPTTVIRAQEINARLRDILKMSGPERAASFSVAGESEIRARFETDGGLNQEMPVLEIGQGDVVGYNRRSHHRLTQEELAFWYRSRLQAFWDALARAEPPGVESDFPEVVALARLVQSAKATADKEGISRPEALQRALSQASQEDLNVLQESVFAAPEILESRHHQPER